MKIILLLVSCITISIAGSSLRELWSLFKKIHGKSYPSPSEEHYRISVFADNLKLIEEHNAKYAAGLVSYKMKLNKFADLTLEEMTAKLTGFNKTGQLVNHKFTGLKYMSLSNVKVPDAVDWREKGAVTSVKDQGQCGGCWAFSTTGALEGQLFRKTGKLVSLSEQQLIDCSSQYGNQGCNGGLMDYAFEYIEDIGGVASEQSYPYQGLDGDCRYRRPKAVQGTSVREHVDLPEEDEEALKVAVATVGPVSVAVSAGNSGFLNYGGGIFNGEYCSSTELDHGVLLVGYGTDNGKDYWIIKNSWNSGWGEDGYMRLARNKGNLCGIASMASYPLL